MEFLTTPDLANGMHWASAPAPPSASPAAPPAAPPAASPLPAHTPRPPPSTASTPHHPTPAPFYAPVDRAGIKNSFQSLFSPAVAATPALFPRSTQPPGLTPFINGLPTPSLVPPPSTMLSAFPPLPTSHLDPAPTPSPPAPPLSSPYLQAAAKEAVRREFLNMPTYVSPAADSADHHRPHQDKHIPPASLASPATSSSPLPHSAHHQQRHVSPNSGYAKVPSNSSPVSPQSPHTTSSSDPKDQGTVPPHPAAAAAAAPVQHPVQHPFFLPSHPHQHPHGMFMIGQHPQMMMPSAPGPMYAPQGMVMFAGPQHPGFPQGMVMPPAHAAHMQHRPQGPVKPETQVERKDRIEHEKQELIREFKKKTREAALVRFRQKRRERRFGKLIRYDCRKKLADARPRVKGRFVRIKDDEDMEQPQVVPGLNR